MLKNNKYLIIGLSLVLLIRLLYVGLIFNNEKSPVLNSLFKTFAPKSLRENKSGKIQQGDAFYYDFIANQLASGKEFVPPPREDGLLEVVAPGYPFFLGLFYFVFGNSMAIPFVLYAFLDTITALMLILLLRKIIGLNLHRIEFLFLLLFAFYLPYVVNIISPLTEGLFTFLLVLFFLIFKTFESNNSNKFLILASIVLGLATLTRPITLVFPFWILVFFLIFPNGQKRIVHLKNWLIIMFISGITILPWTVRNYIKYDRLIVVNTNANLAVIGTDTKTSAGEIRSDTTRGALIEKYVKAEKESLVNTYKTILINMLSHPIDYLKLFTNKFKRLWLNIGFEGKASCGSLLTAYTQTILFLIFILSFLIKKIRRRLYLIQYAVLYVSFFHIVFFTAKIRFLIPFIPFLLIIFLLVSAYLLRHTSFGKYLGVDTIFKPVS